MYAFSHIKDIKISSPSVNFPFSLATKLSEAFSEQPDLKLLANLLEDLPQLYEVAVYTNLYYPEKVSHFCSIH